MFKAIADVGNRPGAPPQGSGESPGRDRLEDRIPCRRSARLLGNSSRRPRGPPPERRGTLGVDRGEKKAAQQP